jgi:hypothetical protein
MADHYDDALHVMEKQGGSFVRSLAACYYSADPKNKAILYAAFEHYFRDYEDRFQRHRVAISAATAATGEVGGAK